MNEGTLKFLMGEFLPGSYGEGFADSFWRGIRLQRMRGGEKNFLGPAKMCSGAGIPNRAIGHRPDIPPWQGLKVHFGVVLGCKGGGGKKKTFRSRKFVFDVGARNRAAQTNQDKPKQAKGSLRGQITFGDSGWSLAESVDVSLGDYIKIHFSLGPHHVCHRRRTSAVHHFSFGK